MNKFGMNNVEYANFSTQAEPLVIDTHIHALPSIVMETYRAWVAEARPSSEGTPQMWASSAFEHPHEHIEALDAAGIAAALITFSSNTPAALHATAVARDTNGPESVRQANDQVIAWAKASQGRLLATAFVEPRFGEQALLEMDRVVRDEGVPALSTLTAFRGPGQPLRFLDHPQFLPVLEHAALLKVPVFIHTSGRFNLLADFEDPGLVEPALTYLRGGLSMLVENTLCLVRLIVSGVFDRFPDLRLVFGQLGGLLPFVLGRFDVIYDLVIAQATSSGIDLPLGRKETASIFRRLRDYVGQVYVDTSSMDRAALLCALEALGPDRIFYGSDYPVTPARVGRQGALEMIRSLPVSAEVKTALLGKNAQALLSIGSRQEKITS
jgi:predicted TIM-barrel fold metal-dependent hydrolase